MKRTAPLITAGRWQYLAVLLLTLWLLFAVCPAYCTDYYVATDGNDLNDGLSIDYPFKTIGKAVSSVAAGGTIYLRGGTHSYDDKIGISKSGADGNLITMQNYQNESVIVDFSEEPYGGSYRGISLSGSYWYFKGINIKGAGDNGMHISGSNNIIEFCTFYENRDTGLQLSNGAANNEIINCDSYYNFDPPDGGDADGFAPKVSVGTGNYFYGCRAWQNSDDGYDGYLKTSDDVNTTYENCWCFKNGYLKDGSPILTGNGNGFKMGGSPDKDLMHNVIFINCLCFDNRVKGFDQNNNKGNMTLYNCTAFNNDAGGSGGKNYKITTFPLGSGKTATVTNCVSHGTGGVQFGAPVVQTTNSWMSPFVVTDADFVSIDPSAAYGPRNADGSLPDITFMHLAPGSDLIDGGTDVGLPYNGSAPDLGAFEYFAVIFVDADATGANDGSSWENAYNYLQDALDDAQPGDRIWVAEGTYKPDANSAVPNGTGDRTATFQLKNHVAVYGGYAGYGESDPNARDIDLYKTILSGDINVPDVDTDNSYHVVTGSGTDANTILDGFTITAGNANGTGTYIYGGGIYNDSGGLTVTNCTFSGNFADASGGGMTNIEGSPTLTNCTFSGNSAVFGGGMANYYDTTLTNCTFSGNSAERGGGMYNSSSSPTVTNCTFNGNSAYYGSGMYNNESNPTVTGCTFSGNSAEYSGGGMYNDYSAPMLINCTFSGNSTKSGEFDGGGGMFNYYYSDPIVTNCTFIGNDANSGGGMFNYYFSEPTVTNCTFSSNTTSYDGGGMFNCYGNLTLTNCTFSGNDANNGGGMYNYSCHPTLTNCILWGNTARTDGNEIALVSSASIDVNYCDVEGGQAEIYNDGTSFIDWWTNIDADPNFVRDPCDGGDGWGVGDNDDFGDLHLLPDSPCIDAADNNSVPADTSDLDGDANTTEPIPFDIDGDPRFFDDPCTADTGNGSPPIVDMGSDELLLVSETVGQGQTVTINPGGGSGDLNEDALVVFENQSTSTANVTVTQMASDLHPEEGAFVVMGTTLIIETSLADGEFFMTVVIPFTEADLDGRNWQLLDLKYWEDGDWVTAGTTGPRDVNTPPQPTLGQLKAKGLGAYGVYWDSTDGKGFVWANVDHSTDFTAALLPGDFEPDSDVDFADFAKFAPNWLDTGCGLCDGADLTGDGNVNFYDLKAFTNNWLAGK